MAQYKADVDILTTNDSGPRPANVPLFAIHYYGGGTINKSVEELAPWLLDPRSGASYTGIIDGAAKSARINDDDYIPWAAMPTGNKIARHWSLGGGARTRDQWLANMDQLTKLAKVLAHDHHEYGTELRHLTVDEVRRARDDWSIRGVCTHGDISAAFGESTHDDPGAEFPMDVFLQIARDIANGNNPPTTETEKETDMALSPEDRALLTETRDLARTIRDQITGPGSNFPGWSQGGGRTLYDLAAAVAEVEGVPGTRDTKQ